ncbi:Ms4533A family Cys-rich leader peptide [Rhodococcus sp. HNM0569]
MSEAVVPQVSHQLALIAVGTRSVADIDCC